MLRRLNKEVQIIEQSGKYVFMGYDWSNDTQKYIYILGPSISSEDEKLIKVIMSNQYRFEAPVVLYDDCQLPHFSEDGKCTYCESYLCPVNWNSTITINRLLDDVFQVLNKSFEKKMLTEVGTKLNIEDVSNHLASFL